MDKAILILDMPTTCVDCPGLIKSDRVPLNEPYTYKQLYRCRFKYDEDYLSDVLNAKPDWCPLHSVNRIKAVRALLPRSEWDFNNREDESNDVRTDSPPR